MTISYPPINQVASGVNAGTIAVTTSTSQIVSATPNRAPGSMIVNNTNKVLWVRLDVAANSAAVNGVSSLAIPANGGNYRLPDTYQGAIQGVLAAAATGTVQFVEPFN